MCDPVNLDYLTQHFSKFENVQQVLEVGSFNVNGNSKAFILGKGLDYLGVDLQPGLDVDVICDITGNLEEIQNKLAGRTFDLLICTNVLEHLYQPFQALQNMRALLRPQGYLLIITPLIWDLHEYPHDFYRLNPDFYQRFAAENGLDIVAGTLQFSLRDTRRFYARFEEVPTFGGIIYKGLRKLLTILSGQGACPWPQYWPHTYINLIYQKQN